MLFAVQNQTLRSMLCLDGYDYAQFPEEDQVILEPEQESAEPPIDRILNAMLSDLNKIKIDNR